MRFLGFHVYLQGRLYTDKKGGVVISVMRICGDLAGAESRNEDYNRIVSKVTKALLL
jgi:hypothetical protein